MDLSLNYKDGKPLYEQIFDQIATQILRGEPAADECLPSIRFLAKELNVSVITAKKAYELLEEKGYIYTRAGKGCFVAPRAESCTERIIPESEKLRKEIDYYRSLGVSKTELISLLDSVYEDTPKH